MAESFAWGILAGSSLVLGGIIALQLPISRRLLGLIMAFGAGVLISAVSFELVQEAFETSAGSGGVALGLFAGSLVFFLGDALIDRLGGNERKSSGGGQAAGSALAASPRHSASCSPSRSPRSNDVGLVAPDHGAARTMQRKPM